MEKKRIIFLYTEIASYFLACVKELLKQEGIEVFLVRYKVNKEAPFEFVFPKNLNVYERDHYSDDQLLDFVNTLSPHIIVCSGWIDKGYLKICKHYKGKAVTVLTLDNQWKGSLKQRVATAISPFYLHQRFSHCWVPGAFQYTYARKLGFKSDVILTGFYSCDFDYFHQQYLNNRHKKEKDFPRRFIYTGRYVEQKGITDLWNAFIELQEKSPNEWELWCLGTGNIPPVKHPKIKHFGFVQPKDMHTYITQTGVFILPSHFEPWGVVLHEFSAAGFPIICSSETGAHTAFVENNINGYIYNPAKISELKKAMTTIMNTDTDRLIRMGEKSVEKAKAITPVTWSKQLISLL